MYPFLVPDVDRFPVPHVRDLTPVARLTVFRYISCRVPAVACGARAIALWCPPSDKPWCSGLRSCCVLL